MKECIEEIVTEREGLRGMGMTDEYKTPDSNNTDVVELVWEEGMFKAVENGIGVLILNAIAEAFYGSRQRLNEALSLAEKMPYQCKELIYSAVKKIHTQSNQTNKFKINYL